MQLLSVKSQKKTNTRGKKKHAGNWTRCVQLRFLICCTTAVSRNHFFWRCLNFFLLSFGIFRFACSSHIQRIYFFLLRLTVTKFQNFFFFVFKIFVYFILHDFHCFGVVVFFFVFSFLLFLFADSSLIRYYYLDFWYTTPHSLCVTTTTETATTTLQHTIIITTHIDR